MIRQFLGGLVIACVLACFPPAVFAQTQPGMDLLTGIGYHSVGSGPYVLMGAELTRRSNEFGMGLRISNELGTLEGNNTLSLVASGDWSRMRLPFYTLNLGVTAHLSQRQSQTARDISIQGDGSYGNLRGNLIMGYAGRQFSSFPWAPEDLGDVASEGKSYYYFQGRVTASVLPSHGLRWSQDVEWQRYVNDERTAMSLVTGPDLRVGNGRVSLQSGIVIGPDGMVPLTRLSYRIDSLDTKDSLGQLELAIDTTTLSGGGAVLHGTYTLEADWWKVQALVRVEQDNIQHPKLYFSILPSF